MKNIDINSFEVLPNSNYARDKFNIYYPISISCLDYEDCGVCWCTKYKLEKANPQTFIYLGKDYVKDRTIAYFRGKEIQNADGESFEIVNGGKYFYFAKDNNNVYKHGELFKEADSKTFYYKEDVNRNGKVIIIGDKDNKWEYLPPDKFIKLKKKNN